MLVSQLTLLNLNKQQVVKQLEKIELDDIQPSSRRYPFVKFTPEREISNDLLIVQNLSKTIDGEKVLDNVSFTMNPNDKAILIGDSEIAKTTLLKILAGEMEPTKVHLNGV